MSDAVDLYSAHCKPCEGSTVPMTPEQVQALLQRTPGWASDDVSITRTFTFKNHYEAMAFANAVAFISHREDHHPTTEIGYKTCTVRYSTHSIGGLSANDFICAAKVNALLPG